MRSIANVNAKQRSHHPGLVAVLVLSILFCSAAAAKAERVRMVTNLGDIDVVLFEDAAPITVANFLRYVDAGKYVNSLIHRSVPGFVIQGGGYVIEGNQLSPVETYAPIVNEFQRSNVRGTIAMAKAPDAPNSATSQWFFNLADNSGYPRYLDTQNGGFTVFGEVMPRSLAVLDAIAAVPRYDAIEILNSAAFGTLPLLAPQVTAANLVIVSQVIRGVLDLADAVSGLQIVAGIPGPSPAVDVEINNDGRIGLEDVIQVLRKLAQSD
jgi:cyclophilin family peptidyl-prolyl cis-trans isomerase